jgi:integrase
VTVTSYAVDPLRDTRHREARSARELADWLAWLELGGTAPRTLDAYERTCAGLLRNMPDTPFDEFTDGDLARFLMTFPAKSRRIRKAHISSWFKWGYKTDRIAANPVEKLPVMKRTSQPVIDVFTDAERAALCALPSPDGQLMTLLFDAGLRKAEAIHMRVRRLDLDNGLVIVKEGAKGSKDRVVPMTQALRTAAAELVLLEGLEPDDYLWYDKPGGGWATRVRHSKPIGETSFGRWWTRCLYDADVEYRKPHTTRHTFATRWRQRGLDLDELQQLMGHASVATTSDMYVHTKVDAIARKMDALIAAEAKN